MDEFAELVKYVEDKCSVFVVSTKHSMADLPKIIPSSGVYILSENNLDWYVGRSNHLRRRLRDHTQDNHNKATFAFLLARKETGNITATYETRGSRQDLLKDPVFRSAFDHARERIRKMDVRFIEEPVPVRQALLQICAKLRVKAEYPDLDNH